MNQEQALKLFPIGMRVQFPKTAIISETGSIDDLSPIVLGTIVGYAGRVAVIQPDADETLVVYALPTTLFPFPLSA